MRATDFKLLVEIIVLLLIIAILFAFTYRLMH